MNTSSDDRAAARAAWWDAVPVPVKIQLISLKTSLQEFNAGVRLFGRSLSDQPNNHSLQTFLMNAILQYLHAYYLASDTRGALPVLRKAGLHDWAGKITRALDAPMGDTTVRGFLQQFRNANIAHPAYDAKQLGRRVFRPAKFGSRESDAVFSDSWAVLLETTDDLFRFFSLAVPDPPPRRSCGQLPLDAGR